MHRVNAQLLRVVADELADQLTSSGDLVTLTDAWVSRDLKQAKITVSASARLNEHVAMLNKDHLTIRRRIAPKLSWKSIPSLTFVEDTAGQAIARTERLLDMLP